MRRLGSLIMKAADANRVPAGAALAVDRERFSQAVTEAIHAHPRITVAREEIAADQVGAHDAVGHDDVGEQQIDILLDP